MHRFGVIMIGVGAVCTLILSQPASAVVSRASSKPVELKAVGGTTVPSIDCIGLYERISTAAEVANNTDKVATGVNVVWQFQDASGKTFDTASESIDIPPHQVGYAVPNDVGLKPGEPAPARFRARIANYRLKNSVQAQMGNTKVEVANLKFGFSALSYTSQPGRPLLGGKPFCPNGRLDGTITNNSGFAIPAHTLDPNGANEIHIKCALFNGKKVIGGFFTFIGPLAAGASTPFDGQNGLTQGLSPSEARCSTEVSQGG